MARANVGGSKKKASKSGATKRSSKKSQSDKSAAGNREARENQTAQGTGQDSAQQDSSQASSALDNAQLPARRGKVGVFGGPKDRGIKPDDKLSLPTGPHFAYERIRSLNPKSFYCAMRWDYHVEHMSPEEGKRWWANKKLVVTNPQNGNSVIVRAVDYGPHENTGLDISVSPGAALALEVEVGDEVEMAFADQKAPTGPVE